MNRVLILTNSQKKSISLEKKILQTVECDVNRAETLIQAQSVIKTLENRINELDIVIIQKELDEDLLSFIKTIIEKTKAGILYIEDENSSVENELTNFCVYKLKVNYSQEEFNQIVNFIISTKKRYCDIYSESQNYKKEIQDEKMINRAKCVLIQYLNMTETQAHKYIEKQAMNLRLSKTEISENILKTYETTNFPDR